MTSQPETAKHCCDAHRLYAWRAARRELVNAGLE